jgi:hypothetical protein
MLRFAFSHVLLSVRDLLLLCVIEIYLQESDRYVLEGVEVMEPVFSRAIEIQSQKDEAKLNEALKQLMRFVAFSLIWCLNRYVSLFVC